MAGANFTNDYGTGVVTADGFDIGNNINSDPFVETIPEEGGDQIVLNINGLHVSALGFGEKITVDGFGVMSFGPFTVDQLTNELSFYPFAICGCSNGDAGSPCMAYSVQGTWFVMGTQTPISVI